MSNHRWMKRKIVPLALAGILAAGCSEMRQDIVDGAVGQDATCVQQRQGDAGPQPPQIQTFDLTQIASDCATRWSSQAGALRFDGTAALDQCQYGFTATCAANVLVPISTATMPGSTTFRISVMHAYSLSSGVTNPPLAAPTNVRILRGALQLYDGDPLHGTPALLGALDVSGEQPQQQRTDFYIKVPATSTVYAVFTTRVDCSQWPLPHDQASWSWSIGSASLTYP